LQAILQTCFSNGNTLLGLCYLWQVWFGRADAAKVHCVSSYWLYSDIMNKKDIRILMKPSTMKGKAKIELNGLRRSQNAKVNSKRR
jgi:hypothetical protein